MEYNWISLPSNLQYQLVSKKGWIVCICARRQTPQSNIGNPYNICMSVSFINRDPSQGIHLLCPHNIRYPLPLHIIPPINHDSVFSLMRSEPSGPPPLRAYGYDHVMASCQYGHVHEWILLLCEDYVRNIHQNPPEIAFIVCCYHEHYVLLLMIVDSSELKFLNQHIGRPSCADHWM